MGGNCSRPILVLFIIYKIGKDFGIQARKARNFSRARTQKYVTAKMRKPDTA